MERMRKNFYMQSDLNPRLKKYADETGFSESQIICLAMKQFFDQEDMKRVMSAIKPEDMISEMIKYAEKMKLEDPSISSSADLVIDACKDELESRK